MEHSENESTPDQDKALVEKYDPELMRSKN